MTSRNLSHIEAILFDIDGTLADTDDAMVARVERWLRFVRLVLPHRDAHRAARQLVMAAETPVNKVVAWLDRTGLDQALGPVLEWLHRLRGITGQSKTHLIPGVLPALERLSERYPLGIVTAREQRSAQVILEMNGLGSLFRCVATARTCQRAKPHPDPVLWAVSQLGLSPQQCLMVGDTTSDILAGRAAGALTVGVLCGFGERDELEDAGADLILDHTAQVAALLLGD